MFDSQTLDGMFDGQKCDMYLIVKIWMYFFDSEQLDVYLTVKTNIS